MTVGQWLGTWLGNWLGSASEHPEGSMQGNASVSIGALAVLSATANLSGEALVAITSSGAIEAAGEPIPADVSGAATIAITSTGKLTDALAPELPTEPVVNAGSGTGSDAGTGYRYIDRAWVKGLKVVKIGTSWQSAGSVKSGVFAGPTVRTHRTKTFGGTVRSTSHCVQKARAVASGCPHQTLKADSACQSKTAKSIVSMYNGSSTSLGADELLAIFNWM